MKPSLSVIPALRSMPMPVYEAEAIVLRQYSLSDSDRIIVFITREFGKDQGSGPGSQKAQEPARRMSGTLNHIRLEFYVTGRPRFGPDSPGGDSSIPIWGRIPSLNQIYAFSYFAEIANEIVQDNQPNSALFRLLLASLKAGGEAKRQIEALVRYFEIWCLKLSGLLPNYAYCSNCGKCVKDDGFFAWLESGQVAV